jgi:hypothetical protein
MQSSSGMPFTMIPVEPFPLNMASSHLMGISLLITRFSKLLSPAPVSLRTASSFEVPTDKSVAPAVDLMKFRRSI